MKRPETLSESIVCDGRLEVRKGVFRGEDQREFERYSLMRQDAAVVLLFDRDRRKVILTRQFRYPVAQHSARDILEIVAGKIDEGEDGRMTAFREVEEESGYVVKPENMHYLTQCFVSPGYSTERFHFFYAEVTAEDKTAKGGGLEAEHETIELVELDVEVFLEQIRNGVITDSKTILAGLFVEEKLRK